VIPLSDRALAIIEDLKTVRHNNYLFPGPPRYKDQESKIYKREPRHVEGIGFSKAIEH
jgi:hypothetical protein